jgi:hypothetical protein
MKSSVVVTIAAALAFLTPIAALADGVYEPRGHAGPSGCYKFTAVGYGFRESDAFFWATRDLNRAENRWANKQGLPSLRVGGIHAVYTPYWRIKTQAVVWQKVCRP